VPFLDLAAHQVEFAQQIKEAAAPEFARLGLALDSVTMQNVSLPDDLQKVLDQKIGMGMVGQDIGQDIGQDMGWDLRQDMCKFVQHQTSLAMPWAWAPVWRWAR
jgi:membrane protease subunit (stomatin/prohibitin family)